MRMVTATWGIGGLAEGIIDDICFVSLEIQKIIR